jgi:hypothetical protein
MIDDGVWSTGLLLHSVYKLVQDALLLILSFDPAQKRIQVSDRSRHRPKILDPSSNSQIHLWSKSQISNLKSQISNRLTVPSQLYRPTVHHNFRTQALHCQMVGMDAAHGG